VQGSTPLSLPTGDHIHRPLLLLLMILLLLLLLLLLV
jgi:hypothetical protein